MDMYIHTYNYIYIYIYTYRYNPGADGQKAVLEEERNEARREVQGPAEVAQILNNYLV